MKNITITIVGNNNVGKSSLFNFLTKTNKDKALVDNKPGITIDRKYGRFFIKKQEIICIDTISYQLSIALRFLDHFTKAIYEANFIFFLVDAIRGLTYHDINLSKFLYLFNKKIFLLVNKIETNKDIDDFWQLGYKRLYPISLQRNIGIYKFYKDFVQYLLDQEIINRPNILIDKNKSIDDSPAKISKLIKKIVILGLPNVGKSTLVNTLIKNEDRIVVNNQPGTTHDPVEIEMVYKENHFSIIDTAGICKPNKKVYTSPYKENTKIINKSLHMVHIADLILLLLDATKPLSAENSFLLNYLIKLGRTFLIVVNKIDNIDRYKFKIFKKHIYQSLYFLKFTNIIFISALHNIGITNLLEQINNINNLLIKRNINTSLLTNLMKSAFVKFNQYNNYFISKKIRLKYAHLGGWNPILIIIHGKNVQYLYNNYKKYFQTYFSGYLNLPGHQIKIYFKQIR